MGVGRGTWLNLALQRERASGERGQLPLRLLPRPHWASGRQQKEKRFGSHKQWLWPLGKAVSSSSSIRFSSSSTLFIANVVPGAPETAPTKTTGHDLSNSGGLESQMSTRQSSTSRRGSYNVPAAVCGPLHLRYPPIMQHENVRDRL